MDEQQQKPLEPSRTLLFLGSGGHTGEMVQLMTHLTENYSPRLYMLVDGDAISEAKAQVFEKQTYNEQAQIVKIPRSRRVGQSYLTSIFTTLWALFLSFLPVFRFLPDVVLCNGPGSCVPVCIAAFLLKTLRIKDVTIVYVESVCRVHGLSLSGKILQYIADLFFVQWQELATTKHRKFVGRIV
eukprot:m.147172 g.147172  ORF g.147172 m.147172 type:complete len:184 (-) comp14161_c0_seq1:196-747(-)